MKKILLTFITALSLFSFAHADDDCDVYKHKADRLIVNMERLDFSEDNFSIEDLKEAYMYSKMVDTYLDRYELCKKEERSLKEL